MVAHQEKGLPSMPELEDGKGFERSYTTKFSIVDGRISSLQSKLVFRG
jgi:hypothetical protein